MCTDITLTQARLRFAQFGALVRQTRIKRGQTLAMVSHHCHIDLPSLSRIERGYIVISEIDELSLVDWLIENPDLDKLVHHQ